MVGIVSNLLELFTGCLCPSGANLSSQTVGDRIVMLRLRTALRSGREVTAAGRTFFSATRPLNEGEARPRVQPETAETPMATNTSARTYASWF